jgi:hypothetical protein
MIRSPEPMRMFKTSLGSSSDRVGEFVHALVENDLKHLTAAQGFAELGMFLDANAGR